VIKVWGRKNAYNVQKVLWLMGELDIDYEHIDVGSMPGDLDTQEFLAKNPNGRIPLFFDKQTYIWESNTILRYLAASYGKGEFWNDCPVTRTHIDRWLDWELSTLQPDFLGLFWNYYRTPQEQHNHQQIEYFRTRCALRFELINNHLKNNQYMIGETFSIADIAVGTCLYRYFTMDLEIAPLNQVNDWYRLLLQRPSYKNNIAVAFEELKGRLEF